MSQPPSSVAGHCYCGTITYEVSVPAGGNVLFPPCYCHCDSCRRAHSAPLYHVACIDGNTNFKITAGTDRLVKYHKPGAPKSITRCFCEECGTKILNEFDAEASWVPEGVKPMVFFPNTLREEDQAHLPELFKAKFHNCKDECVLDMALIRSINDVGEKPETTLAQTHPISVKGHCYCNSIAYEIDIPADDAPLVRAAYCHCGSCRRSHAAPLYHVSMIPAAHFNITRGADLVKAFRKPCACNGLGRCFCKVCGTRVYNTFDKSASKDGKVALGFFPDTLSEEDRVRMPAAFRPKFNSFSDECVLDFDLIKALADRNEEKEKKGSE